MRGSWRAILVALSSWYCWAQTSSEELANHASMARKAQARQDFPTAIREFGILARSLPNSAQVLSNLGVALYFNADTERALAELHKAERIDSGLFAPHLFSGLAWYRLGKTEFARKELETAVKLNEADLTAHTYLGYVYLDQQRYSDALQQFGVVARADPANLDVAYAMGNCYLAIGKTATKELLQIAPTGSRVLQLAGEQFELRGDRQKALALFQSALQQRPDLADVRHLVLENGGRLPASNDTDPKNVQAREDELYHQAHDAEAKARSSFERITQISPDSYRAHQVLADSYVAEGRLDEAIAEYRTVEQEKPDLPGINASIGELLLRSAKAAEALKEFRTEMRKYENSSVAEVGAAKALLVMGLDSDAERLLKRAAAAETPSPEILKLLGKIALHRHEYQNSIAVLTRYCEQVKDDASAYYLLTQAYRSAGNTRSMKAAAALYEKISQGAEQRTEAQKALQGFEDGADNDVQDQ